MQFTTMIGLIVTMALVPGAVSLTATVSPAAAGTHGRRHFRAGQICSQDRGSTRWAGTRATAGRNVAAGNVVSRDNCTGWVTNWISTATSSVPAYLLAHEPGHATWRT